MTARRARAVAIGGLLVAAAVVAVAGPRRFIVDGLSMAPGLMPGDIVATGWLPQADGKRNPRRFERWVIDTLDGAAIKRVAGLPGERVAIQDGELLVEGVAALKSPFVLAELAQPVDVTLTREDHAVRIPPTVVLDDAAFATEVNRALEPVADVGIAATIRAGSAGSRVRVTCGAVRILWRLPAALRCRLIAGRLDGRLVAVAWRAPEAPAEDDRRLALPSRVPAAWQAAPPWPSDLPGPAETGIDVEADADGIIEQVVVWRDIHHRPDGTGSNAWQLDGDSYLLLGDFPTASIDSRAWGPRPRRALLHRVAPAR